MKKDSLIVLSGGMDSTTMLYEYADSIALAVNFMYGANHNNQESKYAKINCERLGIPMITVALPFVAKEFKSSLLEGGDAIPVGEAYDDKNMASTVVPFRNGIMLSIAAGIAESHGLNRIMIANHGGDHAVYPDCRPGFIDAMTKAIAAGTYANIQLWAPYTNLTKSEIARRGAAIGVDYSLTYSCYKGAEMHCGECATCIERRQALVDAGLTPDC